MVHAEARFIEHFALGLGRIQRYPHDHYRRFALLLGKPRRQHLHRPRGAKWMMMTM